jgi:tungstate transport system substrate-binding protein
MDRRGYLHLLGVGGGLSVAGCAGGRSRREASSGTVKDGTLTLATATTAYDSGLLDALNPGFREAFGTPVKPLVQGTGAALRTARDGDCDVVLVHARPLEDAFLREGHGLNRRTVMVNDFLVVGPPGDPAGAAAADPVAAFRAIAAAEAPFVSRGDRSGTHIRERRLWEEAGIDPTGRWYRETGQGMGDTLRTASEFGAYTLTDRGTFLTVRDAVALATHVDRGIEDPPPLLRNEYGVIAVDPARHDTAYPLALAYVGYLTGPGQARIADFEVDSEPGFRPVARSQEPDFQQYVPLGWSGEDADEPR